VERIGDLLTIAGAAALFTSLFLTWSHQLSPGFLARFGGSDLLRGVPANPDAWQLYSSVDVLLALLAGALVLVALRGNRTAHLAALVGAGIALAFTLHALGTPPTNGVNAFDPSLRAPAYVSSGATAGAGETVALAGLGMAIAGLVLSFGAE
jgi:hypothetical protein